MFQSCLYSKRNGGVYGLYWLLMLGLPVLFSFRDADPAFCKKSGIKGYVQRVSGNQMPSVDQPPPAPRGLQTTLYIYELTHTDQVTRSGSSAFYTAIHTKLIQKVKTKEDGSFRVKLKPGTYSLFVKKDQLFYANIYDGNNNIYPVTVEKCAMTTIHFRADYDATY